jgi:hypothetical protein
MSKNLFKAFLVAFLFESIAVATDEMAQILVGHVKEVDVDAHRITVQVGSGTETLPFTDSTKLTGIRPESSTTDVLPGDNIIALYRRRGGEIRTQEIKDIELPRKIESVEGNVTRVYRYARLIFIRTSDGKEMVLHIADDAILTLNGRLVSPVELAAEQAERVKLYYTTHLGMKTVQAMESPEALELP